MTTHPETSAALAAAIISHPFTTGTISSPLKKPDEPGSEISYTEAVPETLAHAAQKIRLRQILVRSESVLQAEFFINRKTFHRTIPASATAVFLETCFTDLFTRGEFMSPETHISVLVSKKGTLTLIETEQKNTAENTAAACCTLPVTSAIPQDHDRKKRRTIPEGTPVPFLVDLGVMTADGTVIKSKYPKFRQINRYLEFVTDVIPRLREISRKKNGEPVHIVDFGCGKSYLTFALYYYLRVIEGISVTITGLDLKEDVIAHCSTLAKTYGYDGLSFMVGDIAQYRGEAGSVDMVVSLHACDTATDFALLRAIEWKAPVIFAVPCCQHEINTQLGKAERTNPAAASLKPLMKHGLIRERFAALLTDTLRAELLESCGYRVQLVEFIDMAHTPKNILIRAVNENTPTDITNPSQSYRTLADFFSVSPTLEKELYKNQHGGDSAGEK